MATEFKLPELGENIETGDLVRLMIKPGASITEGEPVMELETDKAVVEVPSSVTGTIGEIRVKEGDKLRVGQVIFTVENGTGTKPASRPTAQPSVVSTTPVSATPVKPAPAPAPQPERRATSASSSATASEFKLPELGENIDSGDLVRLMISVGTNVSEGQPVMELETDKAVVEVPSTVTGVVREIKVKEGQKIKVGEVIFTLEGGVAQVEPARRHEPVEHISGQQAARLAFQLAMRAEGKTEEQALPPDQPPAPAPAFSMPVQLGKVAGTDRDPVPAAPHVRRLAREIGVEIRNVQGSGPGGRISEDDVKLCAKNALIAATAAAQTPRGTFAEPELPDFAKWGKTERVSMRGVRRKTAEHLRQAWNTIPHVTQQDRADITELEQLRAKFAPRAEEAGGKMTVTAIALKVCASALKVFPQFNASIDMAKEEIVYKQYISIGVAVDTDRGLLVPVIRDVDKKNIVELAAEMTQLSKKARDRKLTPEEMEGGTFTITNLGGIGGTGFSPIVNHPEVAILGLSRSRMEPEWVNNKFEPRLILPLSLSYDHRLIDGADAARFLRWIAEAFEQPFLLSVQG
ncbi:MAG TPA: dihydrolipoyllysine-residue acetyltransferase [Terriglobales bacterium]|jgi:pyruvate dehydrogenase E2 component (dihydrolipoamide acetyltransferase)|nr:dihydrolipoyllysine-residue acetyltransferase [Terriglobales bacterium]